MRQVKLTSLELRWVRSIAADIGVRAAALHLCCSRITIRAIVGGRATVYRQSAESIRARLVADVPSREEIERAAAARHQRAQQVRWADDEAREVARRKAVKQWSDPEARRRMSEIKLRGVGRSEHEVQRTRARQEEHTRRQEKRARQKEERTRARQEERACRKAAQDRRRRVRLIARLVKQRAAPRKNRRPVPVKLGKSHVLTTKGMEGLSEFDQMT